MVKGKINSFQSMGAVDGPGVRCVVFLQGCPLRCAYCHNPDTWYKDDDDIEYMTPEELLSKVLRFRSYWGKEGGVTLSGGEPLLQAEFVAEFFKLCHENGVNTCLDTAGSCWNSDVERVLANTDLCMLDYKMTNEEDYQKYIGCSMEKPIFFMKQLAERKVKSWVRYVVCPTVNDTVEAVEKVKEFAKINSLNEKIELLPFHKLCQSKYDNLGLEFPFGHLPEPTKEKMAELNAVLEK